MSGVLLLFCLSTAVPAQAPPAFRPKPFGSLKQVMRGILLPNSDAIFNVARKAPQNDQEWSAVQASAVALAESASLITMPGRLRDDGRPVPVARADWIRYTQELSEAAKASYKAAQARTAETVVDSTDRLVEACDSCHKVYRDKALK